MLTINLAKLLDSLLNHGIHVRLLAHVARDPRRLDAQCLRFGRYSGYLVGTAAQVCQRNIEAVLREAECDGPADALCGAGYDCDFTVRCHCTVWYGVR